MSTADPIAQPTGTIHLPTGTLRTHATYAALVAGHAAGWANYAEDRALHGRSHRTWTAIVTTATALMVGFGIAAANGAF